MSGSWVSNGTKTMQSAHAILDKGKTDSLQFAFVERVNESRKYFSIYAQSRK